MSAAEKQLETHTLERGVSPETRYLGPAVYALAFCFTEYEGSMIFGCRPPLQHFFRFLLGWDEPSIWRTVSVLRFAVQCAYARMIQSEVLRRENIPIRYHIIILA